jgi:hypothetical protein
LPSELQDLGLDANYAGFAEESEEVKEVEVEIKEEVPMYKQILTRHLPIIGKVPMSKSIENYDVICPVQCSFYRMCPRATLLKFL